MSDRAPHVMPRHLLRRWGPALLLAIACAMPSAPRAADNDDDGDAYSIPKATAAVFARRLQAALRQHDVHAVAALVTFPLRVNGPGQRRQRITRAMFAARFDAIFTPAVIAKVLQQDPTNMFQRDQGVMFGNGQVWAAMDCPGRREPPCPVRVTAVNIEDP